MHPLPNSSLPIQLLFFLLLLPQIEGYLQVPQSPQLCRLQVPVTLPVLALILAMITCRLACKISMHFLLLGISFLFMLISMYRVIVL